MRGSCTFVIALGLGVSCLAQTTAKEARALAAYPLTMDHVTRHYQALADLTRREQEDAGLRREIQGWSALPLEQQVQMYGTNPQVAEIIKAHGITPRDQVMTQTALVALMIALPSIEQKRGPTARNKLQFNASSAGHVKFYHEHQAEIAKLGADLVDVALGKK